MPLENNVFLYIYFEAFKFIREIPEYAIISLNRDIGFEHAILWT